MLLKRVRKTTTFLSLRVSEDVKKRYEKIVSALREKGYEIDQDDMVLRVIRSIEKESRVGEKKRKEGEEPGGILPPAPPV